MNQRDLAELIRSAVPAGPGQAWADLGAGEGNFTLALHELLGPEATIIAIDRDRGALATLAARLPGVRTLVGDFREDLGLVALDGILMANSLHFVRDKPKALPRLRAALKPGGRLVIVEYETDHGNPWVPHPMSFATWQGVASSAGFMATERTATVPSRHFGAMYCAVSRSAAPAWS